MKPGTFFKTHLAVFNCYSDSYCRSEYGYRSILFFGSPRFKLLNKTKPFAGDRVRISKPYAVIRNKPRVVIAGNSRPEMGINPQNQIFSQYDYEVFNLATPGSSFSMQVRHIQHALSTGNVELVLFGIDFLDFLLDRKQSAQLPVWPGSPMDYEKRLAVTAGGEKNNSYLGQRIIDYFQIMFSIDSAVDSASTICCKAKNSIRIEANSGSIRLMHTMIILLKMKVSMYCLSRNLMKFQDGCF